MSPRKLGAVLKRLREERGLTQLELAKTAGGAQGYISALEAGHKDNPSVAVMRKLAKVLNVPISTLLD